MIENFCKFVGIDKLKILDKNYDYAYWYTEESPFEVMKHIDEYAPYVEHVVCCSKSNWPEKAEQLQQSKEVPVTVLEFLQQNKCYHKCFGVIISHILNTQFVPLFFDEVPGLEFDESDLEARFEEMRKFTKLNLWYGLKTGQILIDRMPVRLPCTIPELIIALPETPISFKPMQITHHIDIIIVDSEYNKRFEGKPELNPQEASSGLYDVTRYVLPDCFFLFPGFNYRMKYLSPDIDTTDMIQPVLKRGQIFLKSDRNLDDYALPSSHIFIADYTAILSMDPESEQKKKDSLSSHELFEPYEEGRNKHYRRIMRCIEQLTELVLSFDLASLIDESANEELIKSFKQCPQFLPFESDAEDEQQIEEEQPFDASEFSFALLQWIKDLGGSIYRFSQEFSDEYIEAGGSRKHIKRLNEYITSEKLLQAIDSMNEKLERLKSKEEQQSYDNGFSRKNNLRYRRYNQCNALEEFKFALESYREKLCAMMTFDEK